MWLVVRLVAAIVDARNPAATESIADDTVGEWYLLTSNPWDSIWFLDNYVLLRGGIDHSVICRLYTKCRFSADLRCFLDVQLLIAGQDDSKVNIQTEKDGHVTNSM